MVYFHRIGRTARAGAKGRAIIATVIPAKISFLILVLRLLIFPQGLNSFKIFLINYL